MSYSHTRVVFFWKIYDEVITKLFDRSMQFYVPVGTDVGSAVGSPTKAIISAQSLAWQTRTKTIPCEHIVYDTDSTLLQQWNCSEVKIATNTWFVSWAVCFIKCCALWTQYHEMIFKTFDCSLVRSVQFSVLIVWVIYKFIRLGAVLRLKKTKTKVPGKRDISDVGTAVRSPIILVQPLKWKYQQKPDL